MFHVQTEDSGRRNPHVISHLYYRGTILASEKTDYAERLDLESETLAKDVRALIQEQHEQMLGRLKRGEYDAVISARLERADTAETSGGGTQPVVPPPPEAPSPPPAPPPAAAPRSAPPRAFGDGIVSQKPLDEVILDYLVEKARTRVGEREAPALDRSRKDE